ncbi:protein FAR1-RELATED SEQUENCE 4-like [Arachis stenosperma]|uniref:protein FAR1-RELATED SEQUENCE 4-like n=1 Tax=Arachis stenosperma TaxID=217475 RepID=UPI0025ACD9B3|nr:protein FAR1-RELATED SEQUENCE 4-like [Arachis stenosperma]
MTFKTLEEVRKFYKDYSKFASFSTKIKNTIRKRDEIKNQLITCSREEKWKSKISPTLKTNPSAPINCPARIYVHILKDIDLWIIFKVVLNHSRSYCLDRAEMLKQHKELSMFVCHTIDNNEEVGIRPSKTYQSFVAAADCHHELSFIKKDVRNYIIREVQNVSEQDANEFGKYNLVFGSFVGVNHHGQSTLLRCVLMKNEDIQSFKWLFECWLHCMGEKAPKGILTDQCASMQKDIEMCMNNNSQVVYLVYHEEGLKQIKQLNLLDGGSMIQSSSSLYDAHYMNYSGENYRRVLKIGSALVPSAKCNATVTPASITASGNPSSCVTVG